MTLPAVTSNYASASTEKRPLGSSCQNPEAFAGPREWQRASREAIRSKLDDEWAQQDPREFAWLLSHMAGAKSILEIGSCFGYSLRRFAQFCPGALVRSIDLGVLPAQATKHAGTNVRAALLDVIETLRLEGHDAQVAFGDSHAPEMVAWAKQWAPYDFVFIDGDHSTGGTYLDFLNYGQMGCMIALHDIFLPPVARAWAEIKRREFVTQEAVHFPGEGEKPRVPMGIGIVFGRKETQDAAA